MPQKCAKIPPVASMHDLLHHFSLHEPLPSSASLFLSSHNISHSHSYSTSLSSTMAEAPLPPAPLLNMLPSNWAIILAVNTALAFAIALVDCCVYLRTVFVAVCCHLCHRCCPVRLLDFLIRTYVQKLHTIAKQAFSDWRNLNSPHGRFASEVSKTEHQLDYS